MRALILDRLHIAIMFIALAAIAGCATPLYVQTAGTVGPLQWEAVDLEPGRRVVDGKEVDAYDFTLVVRETRGIGLSINNVWHTIYGGGWVGGSRWTEKFEIPPFCELHLPLSSNGFKAPLWYVRLLGTDRDGGLIDVKLPVALPAEPAAATRKMEGERGTSSQTLSEQSQDVSLANLSVEERRRLQVADNAGLSPKDLALFFSSGVERKVAPLSGAVVLFDSKVPQSLRRALKNIAGGFASMLPLNSTISVPIDLPAPFAEPATIRFTYIGREPQPGSCSRQILIEGVNLSGVTEGDTSWTLETPRFVFGAGWPDGERRTVAAVLDHIPKRWLTDIAGLTFARDFSKPIDSDLGGEYKLRPHSITMYDRAFKILIAGVAPSNRAAIAVAHELGHALDFASLRRVAERHLAALVQFEAFERYRLPGSNEYRIPPGEERAWKANQKEIQEATHAMHTSRSISGSRWKFNPTTLMFEDMEGAEAEDSNIFRKAALMDGPVRITKYSEKSWSEYFAECFSLYVVDPRLLELLRPNIHSYFAKQFPR
jgi:hypothetical protein